MDQAINIGQSCVSLYSQCHELETKLKEKTKIQPAEKIEIQKIVKKMRTLSDQAQNGLKTDLSNKDIYAEATRLCSNVEAKINSISQKFNIAVIIESDVGKGEAVSLATCFTALGKDPEGVKGLMEKLSPGFVNDFKDKGYQQLFAGYGDNVKIEKMKQKLTVLKGEETKLNSWIAAKTEQLENAETSSHVGTKLQLEINDLSTRLNKTKSIISETETRISSNNKKIEKGRETRALFEAVGGERVKITTADNVQIDGTFLSTNNLTKRFREDGGQQVSIYHKFADGTIRQLNGISFQNPDLANPNHIINQMTKMSGIATDGDTGAGLNLVRDGQNVILVPDIYMPPLSNTADPYALIEHGEQGAVLLTPVDASLSRTYSPINKPEKQGTVIISSGNGGVYEMHKREASAFLFQGLNVMLYNFRGYGESKGKPTARGVEQDAEAVYQYVKAKTNQPDRMILLAPLCMSGGAAASVAANHPEVNIFLNQTYSDFHKVLEDKVGDVIDSYVFKDKDASKEGGVKNALTRAALSGIYPLAQLIAGIAAPDLKVAENIAKNKGQKAIFYVHDDSLIRQNHVNSNIEAVANAGQMNNLSVFSAPGQHGTSWPNVKSAPFIYSDSAKKIEKITNESKAESNRVILDAVKTKNSRLQKVADMRSIAKRIEDEGLDPQKFDGVFMDAPMMHFEADNLEKQILADYHQQRKVGEDITDKAQAEIQEIFDLVDPSSHVEAFSARAQVSHFLSKANLQDALVIGGTFNSEQLQQAANNSMRLLGECAGLVGLSNLRHLTTDGDSYVFAGTAQNGESKEVRIKSVLVDQFMTNHKLFTAQANAFFDIKDKLTLSESHANMIKTIKPTCDVLAQTIQNAYLITNSTYAADIIEQTVSLSKDLQKIKMTSLITLEKLSAENIDQAQLSSLQPVIQRDLDALTLFGSDLDTLANSIDHRIKHGLKDFPPDIENVLQNGLKKLMGETLKQKVVTETILNNAKLKVQGSEGMVSQALGWITWGWTRGGV